MIKAFLKVLSSAVAGALILGASATAQSSVPIAVSAAYPKGNSQYDLVVRDTPGTKLVLYIDDKQPSYATVNREDWATFHKVKLADKTKVSFAKQLKGKNGKTYRRPINYARYAHLSAGEMSFTTTQEAAATPASPPAAAPAPAVSSESAPATTPAPAPTPAPSSCTPRTNGGNCYEPGEYCRNSDHGSSGIAGDGKPIICTDNNGWRWEPS